MGARFGLARRKPIALQMGLHALVLRAGAGIDIERPLADAGLAAGCAALEELLAGHDTAPIQVQLACGWSRLLLLPWVQHLTSEARWVNYAQSRFEQIYGENAREWEIRLARDIPGNGRIAAAWPVALRDVLAAHPHVRGVRVALLEHLGVLLAHEPGFSGCIVEIEGGGAGFILLLNGRPCRVRWSRFDSDEGLGAAVRSEWANVLAAEPEVPGADPAIALAPPLPEPDSPRAASVAALAAGLGFGRAFSLPELA
jgi:hypothetical protein